MNILMVLAIPIIPFIAFFLLILGKNFWRERVACLIGTFSTFCALFLSLYFLGVDWLTTQNLSWKIPWFILNNSWVDLSFKLAPLNLLMLVIVSGISSLIHIYSRDYMRGDNRFNTFFAYLSLFTFSMLGLVISSNLLQIYFFWELVGACSFLLVGFWYFKPEAKRAAKKAFIVTRIGDIGLLIAICLIYWRIDSFSLDALQTALVEKTIAPQMITLIAVLIFIGAMGKSGQFPLHTWLPDAMEGPTPISALIHAATMVAAGVYLVANLFFLFQMSTTALSIVAYIGGFTAIFAALIGLAQNDIKRVLAYSTVSQLGYMMLALGSYGYVAGIFHLMTHAFFKALLFLGAGAVIVLLHHEQDIRKMGGLWKKSPILGGCFLIGCLSISGIPPFSGFFSKDEILTATYTSGRIGLFVIATFTAFLTAVYMFRLFFLVFMGSYRGETNQIRSLSKPMTAPLYVLSFFSIFLGFINFPNHMFAHWLTKGEKMELIVNHPYWIPILASFVSILGITVAYTLYGKKHLSSWNKGIPFLYPLVFNKFYMDELYHWVLVKPLKGLSWLLHLWDRFIIDGITYVSSACLQGIGRVGSRLQNGQVQTYVLISLIGFLLLFLGLAVGRLFG